MKHHEGKVQPYPNHRSVEVRECSGKINLQILKFACALGYHGAPGLWLEKTADGPYILSSDRLQNNNDSRSVGNASKKSAS